MILTASPLENTGILKEKQAFAAMLWSEEGLQCSYFTRVHLFSPLVCASFIYHGRVHSSGSQPGVIMPHHT